jgi:RNA polymerase sigma factor (sigma-70 family)
MDQQETVGAQVSDEDLILLARAGDRTAFGELWSRHARAGISVARKFTSSLDADDLVAEAFTRIYRRVLDGGGPDGAFRPYLYTTIRNLASSWGRDRNDIQIEDIEDLTDANVPEDPATVALDARMTASAFRSLPERWQSVLWYTEVEGMTPQDVAPILGLTANGVAALAYRAREGLRTAWLQAHVSEAGATADCRWVTERLGEHARHSLTPREQDRFDAHLLACERCGLVASEVEDVGSSIAVALLPLILGATVGGAVLATIGTASSASALSLPAVPAAFQAVSAAGASASGIGSAAAIPASVAAGAAATTTAATAPVLVGALAVTVILGGGVAAVLQPAAASVPPSAHSSEFVTTAPGEDAMPTNSPILSSGDGTGQDPVGNLVGTITDPVNTLIPDLPIGPGPVPEHQAPDGIVGALIDLDLNGTGMPGATVSTQVAGQVYATVVAANGTWALHLTALPDGVGPIKLKQNLTVLGIPVPINIPLALLSDTLGITVDLLN